MKNLMKWTISLLICLLAAAMPVFGQEENIRVKLNDGYLQFEMLPLQKDGRVFLPLREIFTDLGGEVHWMAETQSILVQIQGETLILTGNSRQAQKNGLTLELPAAVAVHQGSSYISADSLALLLGYLNGYDVRANTYVLIDPMALVGYIDGESRFLNEWYALSSFQIQERILAFIGQADQKKFELWAGAAGGMYTSEGDLEGMVAAVLEGAVSQGDYSLKGKVDYEVDMATINGETDQDSLTFDIVKIGEALYTRLNEAEIWEKQTHSFVEASGQPQEASPFLKPGGTGFLLISENTYEMTAAMIEGLNVILADENFSKESVLVDGVLLDEYRISFDQKDVFPLAMQVLPLIWGERAEPVAEMEENADLYQLFMILQLMEQAELNGEILLYGNQEGQLVKNSFSLEISLPMLWMEENFYLMINTGSDYTEDTEDTWFTGKLYLGDVTDEEAFLAIALELDYTGRVTFIDDVLSGTGTGTLTFRAVDFGQEVEGNLTLEIGGHGMAEPVIIQAPVQWEIPVP